MGAPEYDVIITGYGPVGAVAANLLGRAGLSVAVFERTASVYHLPRASQFDDEVMRIFQAAGLAEEVEEVTVPVRGVDFLSPDGEVLLGISGRDRPGDQGWPKGFAFWQPDLETVLRRGVERLPDVEVGLEHEVEGISPQDDGHVAVEVRDLNSGHSRHVSARWVLGCDGARSFCRGQAGIDLDDLGFHQLWLVVDGIVSSSVDLPGVAQQICDPDRPRMFFPSSGDHARWEFEILEGEAPADVAKPDNVLEMIAPWVRADDVEIVRSVVYSFNSLIAQKWRDGNLVLLGDAAHQMPRFLGQGMCAGIRDAANLAWKITMVSDGRANPRILDSYQTEREAHVRTITKVSADAGRLLQTAGDFVPGAPGIAEIVMPGLAAGLVHHGELAGSAFPQTNVLTAEGSVLLDDVLGNAFALVSRRDPREAMRGDSIEFLESIGASFVQVQVSGEPRIEGSLTVVVDKAGSALERVLAEDRVVVVRPDRYVYGATSDWVGADGITAALRADLGEAVSP